MGSTSLPTEIQWAKLILDKADIESKISDLESLIESTDSADAGILREKNLDLSKLREELEALQAEI